MTRRRKVLYICGAFVLVACLSAAFGNHSNSMAPQSSPVATAKNVATNSSKPPKKATQSVDPVAQRKHYQSELQNYIAKIQDKSNNMSLESSSKLGQLDSEDLTSAYEDSKTLHDLANNYQTYFGLNANSDIPQDLPKNVVDELKKANDDYSTSMYTYQTAWGHLMDYFNNGEKPADLDAAKSDLQDAASFQQQADAECAQSRSGLAS